uniref:HEPN domain-containing protein n=1 Tax=Meloidogyne hapla TaxID=6305 RepID=A0A1I8C1L1_MELHA
MPPQSLLDAGVYNFRQKQAALAAECCWLCACRQLKYYLKRFNIDVNNHTTNSKVIKFLRDTCTDKHLGEQLNLNWTTLEKNISYAWTFLHFRKAHVVAYRDKSNLDDVMGYLEVAEKFCNYVFEINQLDFFKKDELLKNLDPLLMSKVEIPDPTKKNSTSEDIVWKSIKEWVILGNLTKEEVRQNWIKEGTEAYKNFDEWMEERCKVFLLKQKKRSKN